MKPKKNDADSRNAKVNENDSDHRLSTSSGTATRAGEKAGHTRGAAIGGAMGGGRDAGKSTAGKMAAEPVNPSDEHEFWREEYEDRPYFESGTPYEQYGPAFQYGWECCQNHKGESFEEAEKQLERDWDDNRGQSNLSWNDARDAVRDAWQRVEKNCRTGGC